METEKAIDVLKGNLKVSGGDLVEKVQGVFRLCIGEKTWTIDLANGTGEVIDGDAENVDPDATLTMTDDTFINLIKKKTLPQTAFVMRKLKIQGNITKALKVVHVLDAARKPASKL